MQLLCLFLQKKWGGGVFWEKRRIWDNESPSNVNRSTDEYISGTFESINETETDASKLQKSLQKLQTKIKKDTSFVVTTRNSGPAGFLRFRNIENMSVIKTLPPNTTLTFTGETKITYDSSGKEESRGRPKRRAHIWMKMSDGKNDGWVSSEYLKATTALKKVKKTETKEAVTIASPTVTSSKKAKKKETLSSAEKKETITNAVSFFQTKGLTITAENLQKVWEKTDDELTGKFISSFYTSDLPWMNSLMTWLTDNSSKNKKAVFGNYENLKEYSQFDGRVFENRPDWFTAQEYQKIKGDLANITFDTKGKITGISSMRNPASTQKIFAFLKGQKGNGGPEILDLFSGLDTAKVSYFDTIHLSGKIFSLYYSGDNIPDDFDLSTLKYVNFPKLKTPISVEIFAVGAQYVNKNGEYSLFLTSPVTKKNKNQYEYVGGKVQKK